MGVRRAETTGAEGITQGKWCRNGSGVGNAPGLVFMAGAKSISQIDNLDMLIILAYGKILNAHEKI